MVKDMEKMVYKKLLNCYEKCREKTDFVPRVALILGSGLGALADELDARAVVSYDELEDFPISTVPGHKGRFVFGYIGDCPVVVMQGRVHYYEGYDISDVVLPVRLMHMLGAETLFLTNAAGGINFSFSAGDLMLITDQISTFIPSPLRGANIDELGERFPDMTKIYDERLCEIIDEAAAKHGISLKSGVYVQTPGPNYESPAEVRMLRTMGADAVGMSTACEAIAARHCAMRVCGISCISNLASGISLTPLTHDEVRETADRIAPVFKKLVREAISAMGSAEGDKL